MHWFLKNNPRRYFRSNLPLKIYAAIKDNHIDRQKCHSGIQFISNSNLMALRAEKEDMAHALSGISPHGEIIENIASEIIEQIETLSQAIQGLQKGDDLNLTGEMVSIQKITNGLTTIGNLSEKSQKVYSILKGFEQKIAFLAHAIIKFNNETSHTKMSSINLQSDFPIDKIVTALSNSKNKDVALPRTITHLAKYIQIVFDAFKLMNQQPVLQNNRTHWPITLCNASASGVAFYCHSKFPPFAKIDVNIDLGRNEVLKFNGKTVCVTYCKDRKKNIVAIDFEYPDGNVQKALLRYLQKQELSLAYKTWGA